MAFKMKGNPMYRNFGIGSPNKQATISSVSDSLQNKPNPAIEKLIKELEETQDSTNTANQAELERRAKQIQQNVSPKEFNKQIEEHNKKVSPAKQVGPRNKKGDFVQIQNKDAAGPGPEITTTVSGKLPEGVYIGKDGELKNKDGYNYNLSDANKKSFKNIAKNIKKLKAASPNKQRDLGGTKSGKGNVFTKRGRTQKKINAERAETAKLKKEHIAKNKKTTQLAVKAHEEKMIKKQLKNRPKTVVMKGDKDVTDQYR